MIVGSIHLNLACSEQGLGIGMIRVCQDGVFTLFVDLSLPFTEQGVVVSMVPVYQASVSVKLSGLECNATNRFL